jgi:hypothetical protein
MLDGKMDALSPAITITGGEIPLGQNFLPLR